jgi:3-hydroxyisobutyrate dehydrogenase-like beta-hydroxyacid dehydrogenase
MLAFCNAAAAAEALMMGKKSGIDMHKLDAVIRNASGASFAYGGMATKALSGDFTPGFALDLAHKDLRLALERLKRRFNVDIATAPPTVPYRETIRAGVTQREVDELVAVKGDTSLSRFF